MKPWRLVAILGFGVLLALAILAPSAAAVGLFAFGPVLLVIAWGVAVVILLSDIRSELRELRRDLRTRTSDQETSGS